MAASDVSDAYTTFTGVTRLQQGITPTGVRVQQDMQIRADPNPISIPAPQIERLNVVSPGDYNQRTNLPPLPVPPVSAAARTETAGLARSRSLGLPARVNSGARREPRADTPPNQDGDSVPPPPVKSTAPAGVSQPQPSRLTEVYDELLAGYTNPPPPMPSIPEEDKRIQAWARGANNALPPPSRAMSMRAPSSYGSGSMKRRNTKTRTGSRANSRAPSSYEDEEEDYGSGEFEEEYDMSKIRVKVSIQFNVQEFLFC